MVRTDEVDEKMRSDEARCVFHGLNRLAFWTPISFCLPPETRAFSLTWEVEHNSLSLIFLPKLLTQESRGWSALLKTCKVMTGGMGCLEVDTALLP